MNYSERPSWVSPASPQNQGYNGYEESRSPSNHSSGGNSYYGSPTPASPPSNNIYGSSYPQASYAYPQNYASPNNAAYLSANDNNHYASPVLSPGDWNVASPNSMSGASTGTPYPTPSVSTSKDPFMYDQPTTANIPSLQNNAKSDLDIRRQIVASAKANALLRSHAQASAPSRLGAGYQQHGSAQHPTDPFQKTNGSKSSSGFQPRRLFGRERLATSSRKMKKATAEEDFETINDYKCQMDIDRQKDATNKALRLLEKF